MIRAPEEQSSVCIYTLTDACYFTRSNGRTWTCSISSTIRGFRVADPTADHFVPIHVAGGAGENGDTKVLAGIYGALTVTCRFWIVIVISLYIRYDPATLYEGHLRQCFSPNAVDTRRPRLQSRNYYRFVVPSWYRPRTW